MKRLLHFTLTVLAAGYIFLCVQPVHADTVSLLTYAENNGMTVYWDSLSATGLIEKNGHHISFRADQEIVLLDSRKLMVTDAPAVSGTTLLVSNRFLTDVEAFFKTEQGDSPYRIGAIIIDPGHGGKDPGAVQAFHQNGTRFTIQEKDITLAVGKLLYERLSESYPDKQIIITRESDVFLTLGERTDKANSVKLGENEAIVYVSIHINASLDRKASGYEVWYLSPGYRRTVLNSSGTDADAELFPILNLMTEEEYTTESILIAKFIMDGLAAQIGSQSKARGIKAEEWFVVRNVNMPSVLVELGFLTNYEEALNLRSAAYLKKAALGIYNGISAFVTHFERSRGFTSSR
ncbi:MAG: N-acetylmuramoyl-L-alanine amidase [Treponema sp.]|nr:N-acetylmuramoyl-L-alanine amidase [Treponema sp.]